MKETCSSCKRSYYFDDAKVPDEELRYLCPKCGNVIVFKKPLGDEDAPSVLKHEEFHPKSFFALVAGAFSFPLQGNGKILLISGTIFFGIINFFLRYNILPFIGAIAGLFVGGYSCAYLMKIINHSAAGEEELPDFPDFIDWWDSVLVPFFLILSTILFCFIPAIAYYFLIRPAHFLTAPALLLLIGSGLFYLPMGLMAVSMNGTLKSLSPLLSLPSIIRVIDSYIVV